MKGIKLLFFLYLFTNHSLFSQEEKSSFDIGINVTTVFSSFVGNSEFLEPADFPILLRKHKGQSAIRIGIGAKVNSNEFFDNVTFVFRESKFQEYFFKLGIEKKVYDDGKWDFYYGLDFNTRYNLDEVQANDFNGTFNKISARIIGFGGGPFFGVRYQLLKRLSLSTEATLSGLYNLRKSTNFSGFQESVINTSFWEVNLQPPLFLYLNLNF